MITFPVLKQRITAIPRRKSSENIGFLNMIGMVTNLSNSRDLMDVQVTEVKIPPPEDTCSFKLTTLGQLVHSFLSTIFD